MTDGSHFAPAVTAPDRQATSDSAVQRYAFQSVAAREELIRAIFLTDPTPMLHEAGGPPQADCQV